MPYIFTGLVAFLLAMLLMLHRADAAYLAWERADAALDDSDNRDGSGRRVPAVKPFGALTATHSPPPCGWHATPDGMMWRDSVGHGWLPAHRFDYSEAAKHPLDA